MLSQNVLMINLSIQIRIMIAMALTMMMMMRRVLTDENCTKFIRDTMPHKFFGNKRVHLIDKLLQNETPTKISNFLGARSVCQAHQDAMNIKMTSLQSRWKYCGDAGCYLLLMNEEC